jgi:CubicO group peptidase (beta-lactamase class C family)
MIRRNRVPKRSCNAFVATRFLLIYLPTLQIYEKKATVAELHYCPHSTGSQSGKLVSMDYKNIIELMDQHFASHLTEKKIPGVAYGLIKDGKLIHSKGFGETVLDSNNCPDKSSVFRIASMTKSFTATAILLLRDAGKLRLDDDVTIYLPWTDSIGIPDFGHVITIRDLLTMNAGFPTDDPWGDRQESLEIETFDDLVSQGLSFTRAPRMGFEYSNLGYALLGRIISVTSGMDYLDFVKSAIHQSLEMSSTTFQQSEVAVEQFVQGYAEFASGFVPEPLTVPGAFSAMGGLLSNIEDLAKWVAGFQSAWNENSDHPLQKWSRREMQEPQRHARTTAFTDPHTDQIKSITTSYGYGLLVDDDSLLGRFVSHSGGYPGFGSHMRWHPESGWGIVALGNRTYAPMMPAATEAMNMIIRDYFDAGSDVESKLWSETVKAMFAIEELLATGNQSIADEWFAVNMDLDQPRSERMAALSGVVGTGSKISRVSKSLASNTPAHAKWQVSGSSGLVEIEILLTPTKPPKVQTLRVAKVLA